MDLLDPDVLENLRIPIILLLDGSLGDALRITKIYFVMVINVIIRLISAYLRDLVEVECR